MKQKLSGSSLIEVVVAAVIILASFTIAMSVLSKTAGENNALHRIELNCLANQLLNKKDIGEQNLRGVQMQSKINNAGDAVIEQYITGKKIDSEQHRTILNRRRLLEQKR